MAKISPAMMAEALGWGVHGPSHPHRMTVGQAMFVCRAIRAVAKTTLGSCFLAAGQGKGAPLSPRREVVGVFPRSGSLFNPMVGPGSKTLSVQLLILLVIFSLYPLSSPLS